MLCYVNILMSSANLKLFMLWPSIRTSVSLFLVTSIILSKYIMNVVADIGVTLSCSHRHPELSSCHHAPPPPICGRRRRLVVIGAPPPIICRRAADAILVILLHFSMTKKGHQKILRIERNFSEIL